MRLLHTSDWHLGRKLYDRPRIEEHQQFLDWLLQLIEAKQIDVLLLAGDVFDSSIPPARVVDMFYHFLFRLYKETTATAVIIAGNHDSAMRLAAAREFLKIARIHLIGSMPSEAAQYVIPITKNGEEIAVVALPYLPEGEILSHVSFEKQIDSTRRYREAIKMLYQKSLQAIPQEIPKIIMGHFFLAGGQMSDSERTIQVGGSLPLTSEDLPSEVNYIALGHLHRPQRFQQNGCPIIYSGSPIPLTFKEAEHAKKLYMIDVKSNKQIEIDEIVVPIFRPLVRVTGTFSQIIAMAETEQWEGKLIEVIIDIDMPQIGLSDQIREAFSKQGGEVASVKTELIHPQDELELSAEEVTSQSPVDIFKRFYIERYGQPENEESEKIFVSYQKTFNELMAHWHKKQAREEVE